METLGNGRRRAFRSRHRTPMGAGGKLAVIVICAALVLFVLAVLLGTYLRTLTENDPYATDESSGDDQVQLIPADAIKARAIMFGVRYTSPDDPATEKDETSESVAEEDTSNSETGDETNTVDTQPPVSVIGYDAVSVMMRSRSADGVYRLAYDSPIGNKYGVDVPGEMTLGEGIAIIRNDWGRDCYISGVFEIGYISEAEDTRKITREYELALLCELAEAGFDDVILVGFSDDAEEGLSFIRELGERTEGKTLFGLAFDFAFFNDSDSADTIREISRGCGLLALDLYTPDIPILMAPETYVYDRVSRAASIIDKYTVRVLVDFDDSDAVIRSAISAGAYSFSAVAQLADSNEETSLEITEE